MLLPPRLHFEQLMQTQEANADYVCSLAGIFNVATALAYMHKDKRAINLYASVQENLMDVARFGIQNIDSAMRLLKVFNIAETYIEQQSRQDLLQAIRIVKYQIAHGEGNTLLKPTE